MRRRDTRGARAGLCALGACVALALSLAALGAHGHAPRPGEGEVVAGAPGVAGEKDAMAAGTGGLTDTLADADSDDLVRDALGALGGDGATRLLGEGVTSRHVAVDAEEAAREVLMGFRDRGDCVLAQAGYLDLAGSVWGCTVQGDGWVEVTVVRRSTEGGSDVTSVRMDARTWEAELAQKVGEGA